MAESMQAKLKSPRAVLELGVSNEDSKVRNTCPTSVGMSCGDGLMLQVLRHQLELLIIVSLASVFIFIFHKITVST